jgi:hypothetical protein
MFLQEGIDFHAGGKTEQAAHAGFAEAVIPLSLQCNRFEGRARRVLTCGDQLIGKIVRDFDSDNQKTVPSKFI